MTMIGLALVMLAEVGAAIPTATPVLDAQECRAVETPKRLPTVAQLVDITALRNQVAGMGNIGLPDIRVGVLFPEDAGPPQAWVIDDGVEPGGAARLAELVQGTLRPGGAQAGTTLRLHLPATTPIEMTVERSMLCPPFPLDSTESKAPTYQLTESSGNGPNKSWKSSIRQRISADGSVLEARLQPSSGQPDIDRLALEPVYAKRWRPATLDGRPVAVWFAKGRTELVP